MATPTSESQRKVAAARTQLSQDMDELTASARSAVDIPAKVRKYPAQTAALAGGAGFLVLGGPRRLLRGVMGRVRPAKKDPYDGLLPDQIAKAVRGAGGQASPEIKAALEKDFADYLAAKGKLEPQRTREQSVLRTYDSLVGPISSAAAREIVERLFAADKQRNQPAPKKGSGSKGGSGSGL